MTESDAGDILVSDSDHSAPLEFYENPLSCHPFRGGEIERFTNGKQLQKASSGFVEPIEAARNCLLDPWCRPDSTWPSPYAMNLPKFPCLEQVGDQLSSKEDVAPGRLPHSLQGDAFNNTVECLLEHFVELGSRQRLEFEPRNGAVSGESAQRIGDWQSTAKCQKYGRQTRDGDVVDEPCREPIEQVHVVDRQDDRPSSGPMLQILAEDGQQVHLVNVVQVAGKELSQRTEGKRAQRFRSGDPFDVMVRRPAQNLVNQTRFSDSSLSGYQDTGTVWVRNGIGYELLLLGSPDHRPPVHGHQFGRSDRRIQYLVLKVLLPPSGTVERWSLSNSTPCRGPIGSDCVCTRWVPTTISSETASKSTPQV